MVLHPHRHYLECNTGMEHLVMMLPTMMASRRVQVPDSHSGIRMPGEGQRGSHSKPRLRERRYCRSSNPSLS